MLKTFIERPVLSTVISIIIVILGILGLAELPVTQYPDIAPPTVQVNANYPGANAETILESVIVPIEEQINGVAEALEAGIDVRGHLYWSLMDNYEWALGFEKKFGLVEIDYKTLERRIRPSAWRYKELIEQYSADTVDTDTKKAKK